MIKKRWFNWVGKIVVVKKSIMKMRVDVFISKTKIDPKGFLRWLGLAKIAMGSFRSKR